MRLTEILLVYFKVPAGVNRPYKNGLSWAAIMLRGRKASGSGNNNDEARGSP